MATPKITKISDADYEANVGKGCAVVKFYATWCGACKAIEPVYAALAGQYRRVQFFQVDVDQNTETVTKMNINAMPTFMFYVDGKHVPDYDIVGPRKVQLTQTLEVLNRQ